MNRTRPWAERTRQVAGFLAFSRRWCWTRRGEGARTRQGPGALLAAPGPWSVGRQTSVLLRGDRSRVGRLGGAGAGHAGRRRLGRGLLRGGGGALLGSLRRLDGLLGGRLG